MIPLFGVVSIYEVPRERIISVLRTCKFNWDRPMSITVTGPTSFCKVVSEWCRKKSIPCTLYKMSGSRFSNLSPRRYLQCFQVMRASTHLVSFSRENDLGMEALVEEAEKRGIPFLDLIIKDVPH